MAASLSGPPAVAPLTDVTVDGGRPDGTLILAPGVPPVGRTRRALRLWTLVALAVVVLLFLLVRPDGPSADLVRRETPKSTVATTAATTATTATTAAPPQTEATVATTVAPPTAPAVQSPHVEKPGGGKAKGKGGGKGKD